MSAHRFALASILLAFASLVPACLSPEEAALEEEMLASEQALAVETQTSTPKIRTKKDVLRALGEISKLATDGDKRKNKLVRTFGELSDLGKTLALEGDKLRSAALAVEQSAAANDGCPLPSTLAELEAARDRIEAEITKYKLGQLGLATSLQRDSQLITAANNAVKSRADASQTVVRNLR
jgi:hypothetical protein